ncbi:MAG: phytanoyl-CoA dioxygenase family protein [Planctomycetota bacterium]|nr:phytanoyl-CoA dioxygenase family protein [Planctomycetota bacterium]MDA1137929.1 phytanoyl-CoA dioxygenase family protein [Planctomycetota bacterium]
MITAEHLDQYRQEGYFIVDDLIPKEMFEELYAACRRVKDKVRAGEVDVYTHWAAEKSEPWCIRGLIAPEFKEPLFAEYMLHKPFVDCARQMLGDEFRLGWIDLRTNPHHEDFPGGWHRDIGNKDPSLEEEMEILNQPVRDLRWYLALIEDACLQIVPGSHHRNRTEEERECLVNSPNSDLSGQKTIKLKPGQFGFWSGMTIHRGTMKKDVERLTLAASWRKCQADEPVAEKVDGRFEWRLKESVRAFLPAEMHIYYDRWRKLQPV